MEMTAEIVISNQERPRACLQTRSIISRGLRREVIGALDEILERRAR